MRPPLLFLLFKFLLDFLARLVNLLLILTGVVLLFEKHVSQQLSAPSVIACASRLRDFRVLRDLRNLRDLRDLRNFRDLRDLSDLRDLLAHSLYFGTSIRYLFAACMVSCTFPWLLLVSQLFVEPPCCSLNLSRDSRTICIYSSSCDISMAI